MLGGVSVVIAGVSFAARANLTPNPSSFRSVGTPTSPRRAEEGSERTDSGVYPLPTPGDAPPGPWATDNHQSLTRPPRVARSTRRDKSPVCQYDPRSSTIT